MKALQSFKSEDLHNRIAKMLYASIYSEVFEDYNWHNYVRQEFNKLAVMGDFLPRTFNHGGRLWLCFAFKWMIKHGIVEETDNLGQLINRLLYRNEIIWDCSPDIISDIDYDIDGDGVVMCHLFHEDDSLERYALQEKMIAHLNRTERILNGNVMYMANDGISDGYLCSMAYFVKWCDNHTIFPMKTERLIDKIKQLSPCLDCSFGKLIHLLLDNNTDKLSYSELYEMVEEGGELVTKHIFLYDLIPSDTSGETIKDLKLCAPDAVLTNIWESLYKAACVFSKLTSRHI